MKFLPDNQLPIALSRFLEAQGVVSQHVVDIHLEEATNQEIWHYAKEQDYTLVLKLTSTILFSIILLEHALKIINEIMKL